VASLSPGIKRDALANAFLAQCGIRTSSPSSGYFDLATNGYRDEVPTEDSDQYSLDDWNLIQACKKLFIDHGWPDNFRGDELKEARRSWTEEHHRVENARSKLRGDARLRAFAEYSRILEKSAGEKSIIKKL
jgi:hypothetical protein